MASVVFTALAISMLATFRPPAVPLVTHTPFFSCWSAADKLTDRWPTHWTGGTNAILGLVRIDGKVYRWMGPNFSQPAGAEPIPALEQTDLRVTATRTTYTFQGAGVELEVEFCSPLVAKDLSLVGRPVTYLTLSQRSIGSKPHSVDVYVDWTGEWVVQGTNERVSASRHRLEGMEALSLTATDGRALSRSGDQIRIDWGSLYVSGPGEGWIAGHATARGAFLKGERLGSDDMRFPRAAEDDWPVIALTGRLDGPVTYLIAYDEDYAVEYLKRKLRPYWNRRETGVTAMLQEASNSAPTVRKQAREFDETVWKVLSDVGGEEYAQLGSLAYRQCLAGHTLAEDIDGDALMFSKENTSNGCIATVDVTFPASPFFLYFNPEMLKAQVRPILEYSMMPRWKFDFAPHDLGQHPLANGQVYGGGEVGEENQMPVEESANMLLMVTALCRQDKSADFARPYAPALKKWAAYLEREGLDPDNQLCTDDFTGHLAHNANLSIKAIVALAGYGEICGLIGDRAEATRHAELAKKLAGEWIKMAADGDHTKLAFDKPGTWSQKYNLFWDRLLGYNLFPQSLYDSELAFYKAKQNKYGFPLDNRAGFTKTDWLMWCAALAPTKESFRGFMLPVYRWLSETPSRVPFTDWYETVGGETRGMHTRTVIGGVFAPLLLKRGL